MDLKAKYNLYFLMKSFIKYKDVNNKTVYKMHALNIMDFL